MPKCPRCEKEIDHLRCFVKMKDEKYVTLGKDGRLKFEDMNNMFPADGGEVGDDYECPECQYVLFTEDDLARRFLANETVTVT